VRFDHYLLPGPGLELIRNPRRREHYAPLVVTRNPKRKNRAATTGHGGQSELGALRSRLRAIDVRSMRNQVISPVLAPDEAGELLGIDADEVRGAMSTGRVCVTRLLDKGGRTLRVGVRLSELLTHFGFGP
jgi:hypothetical protein